MPTTARLARRHGPFPASPSVLRGLTRGGLPRPLARDLWSGLLLARRGLHYDNPIDWERAVILAAAAVGEHPEQLWSDPLAADGPVARLLASLDATTSLERSLGRIRSGHLDRLRTTHRTVRVPPSGGLSPRARRLLTALVGRERDEDDRDARPLTDADLAGEVQQLRYDRGPRALARLLRPLARALPPRELRSALEYVYQFSEHSH